MMEYSEISVRKMKKFLVFLLCLGLSGCASLETAQFSNKYTEIYNNALNKGSNITIVKEGNFEEIRDKVNKLFESRGYKKVIYSAPEQEFIVITKDTSVGKALLIGNAHPCQILFKFTKAGSGKTRIDLARGSNILITNSEVEKDIREITKLIENKDI